MAQAFVTGATNPQTGRSFSKVLIFTVLLTISAWIGQWALGSIVGMHALAGHATPYLIPEKFWLFNVVGPLSAVAVSLFFVWPGLLLASAQGLGRDLVLWLLMGFVWSMVVLCVPPMILNQMGLGVLRGGAYFGFVALVNAVALGIYYLRYGRGAVAPDFLANRGTVLSALVLGFLTLAVMSAKFYWENFSPDGAGVLNFVRLFIYTDWPFWPPDAGAIQVAPGVTSFLFDLPASWYQRLIGENELAMRLPYILYIGMIYVVAMGLIRLGRDWVPAMTDHGLIIAAFMIYTLSIIYSGGYNPYFGDSPMPAARETLVGAFFLGIVYFALSGQMAAMWVAGIVSYLLLPTGGLWMLLTTAAIFVVCRPRDWRRLFHLGALMVVCAAIGSVGPVIIRAFDMPVPGSEFDLRGIVNRLRYVTFWEPSRLAYLIVPSGILPVVSMFFWKRQDDVARVLTLITAVFFLFWYFQGYRVLLHHFIPAMIPPLVVMWRYDYLAQTRNFVLSRAAIALALIAALWLAFPLKPGLHQFSREIGASVELRGDRYEGYQTRALGTFHEIFGELFPIQYTEDGASNNYFGGPMVWLHYAVQPKAADQQITYVLQPDEFEAPDGATLFQSFDGYSLWIIDVARHKANLATTFTTQFGAPIYQLSRDEIFGKGARTGDRFVIDLVSIARGILGIEKPPAPEPKAGD